MSYVAFGAPRSMSGGHHGGGGHHHGGGGHHRGGGGRHHGGHGGGHYGGGYSYPGDTYIVQQSNCEDLLPNDVQSFKACIYQTYGIRL